MLIQTQPRSHNLCVEVLVPVEPDTALLALCRQYRMLGEQVAGAKRRADPKGYGNEANGLLDEQFCVYTKVINLPARTAAELRAKALVLLDELPRDADGRVAGDTETVLEAFCQEVLEFLDGGVAQP